MRIEGRSGGMIVNAMSVDVEDYFQASAFDRVVSRAGWDGFQSRVVSNTQRVLDLFDRAGVRSTFFVLGWVAERFPTLVREIAAAGHEIASHGQNHQLIYTLTPAQFRQDVRASKQVLEQASGAPVIGFRAPSYSIIESSLWALDILIEEGYLRREHFPDPSRSLRDSKAERHAHVLRRASGSLIEMPASTTRVRNVNLRLRAEATSACCPMRGLAGDQPGQSPGAKPVVFYVHPWELDPDQPRLGVGATSRIRHYAGLDRTSDRLRRLLAEFRFTSVAAVLNLEAVEASARTA